MTAWADRDFAMALEHRLDELLARLCPNWRMPPLPEEPTLASSDASHERINAKRLRVAYELKSQRDHVAALADLVLDAIVHDEDVSCNRQLIEPVLAIVGRRFVQEHLITTVEAGSPLQKVCAVRAWYWSQATLVYRSAEDFHAGIVTKASRAQYNNVADLRQRYRNACLIAFVATDDPESRQWLAHGFLLEESRFPQHLHPAVAQARAIASSDPITFKRLLARKDDGTNLAATREFH